MHIKLLYHVRSFYKALISHDRKTLLWSRCWPDRGGELSIARGALHPHLLAHGWIRLLERKDGEANCPAGRSPLFCAAGSLLEVMSRVGSFRLSALQRRREMM